MQKHLCLPNLLDYKYRYVSVLTLLSIGDDKYTRYLKPNDERNIYVTCCISTNLKKSHLFVMFFTFHIHLLFIYSPQAIQRRR